ncbi:hypothetical protein E4U42_000809 [Claviceps africana]|uniref:Uncharacterized protein n=1 Tax=Claviceps africana TaxID=83212 RepID=A0A8K0IZJ3_9HYPO|nr:hypothetical protein E4U42_000809 [Claviceps africana]
MKQPDVSDVGMARDVAADDDDAAVERRVVRKLDRHVLSLLAVLWEDAYPDWVRATSKSHGADGVSQSRDVARVRRRQIADRPLDRGGGGRRAVVGKSLVAKSLGRG